MDIQTGNIDEGREGGKGKEKVDFFFFFFHLRCLRGPDHDGNSIHVFPQSFNAATVGKEQLLHGEGKGGGKRQKEEKEKG